MKTLISIIIPVYNREHFIAETIQSVLGQTMKEVEVICVDDCSTDKTAEVVKALAEKDSRVRYFKMDKNGGAGPAKNKGMREATGEFIGFIGGDDLYAANDCFEKLYNAAKDNNVRVVGGNVMLFNGTNKDKLTDWGKRTFFEDGLYSYSKDYAFSIGYGRFLFDRKMILDEYKLDFKYFTRYQDPPWFAELMVQEEKFYGLAMPLYLYRRSHQRVYFDVVKSDHLLTGMRLNFKLFQDHGLKAHYKEEQRELKNFIYRAVYEAFGSGPTEFKKVKDVISKHTRESEHIYFNGWDVLKFIRYGLILIKLRSIIIFNRLK